MKARKLPKSPSKFLVKLFFLLYAKKRINKFKLIDDGGLKKITPPYIAVVNHSSFADVLSVASMLLPNVACYVASQTQYSYFGSVLNALGVLPKKQFSVSSAIVKDIKYMLGKGFPVVLYPEAKLSVDGTANTIKPNTAKLVKMLKVPLVSVCFSGCYLHKPRWSKHTRRVPVKASVKLLADAQQVEKLSVEQIHSTIVDNLQYDDFAYQLKEKIEIDSPTLTEGLDGILYICPECGTKFQMTAQGNTLHCNACNASCSMDKLGVLSGRFSDVKSWYAFEHNTVKKEIESGEYGIDIVCRAQQQVKNKFKKLKGLSRFVHNDKGIFVTLPNGEQLSFPRGMFYTMSFSNEYLFLPTQKAIFRLSFDKLGLTTHINIAVEEFDKLDTTKSNCI